MALDTARKLAAAATFGPPINSPAIIPDGSTTAFDLHVMGWGFKVSASGTLTFYGTEVSDVTDNWGGVTFDSGGNLNTSGSVFEAGV